MRPGVVEELGRLKAQTFYVGMLSKNCSKQTNKVVDAIVDSDDEMVKVLNPQGERWEKLVFNVAWNLTAAMFDKDTHQILRSRPNFDIVRQLAREVTRIACAAGNPVPVDTPERIISYARRSKPITPSTLQDRRAGRALELGPLCGRAHIQSRARISNLLTEFQIIYWSVVKCLAYPPQCSLAFTKLLPASRRMTASGGPLAPYPPPRV